MLSLEKTPNSTATCPPKKLPNYAEIIWEHNTNGSKPRLNGVLEDTCNRVRPGDSRRGHRANNSWTSCGLRLDVESANH